MINIIKFKSLFVALLALLFSCNQSEKIEQSEKKDFEKSDLENYGLAGKVKSVTTVTYDAFDKFGEGYLQKTKPEFSTVIISTFDTLGNILSDRHLYIDDAKKVSTIVTNNKGQQIKWISYDSSDDTKMKYGHVYYYDKKDQLEKETDLVDDEVTVYKNTYDKDGRIVSQTGGPWKKYWEYDNGNLVKFVDQLYDMTTEKYYKDGLLYKDVRSPEVYWTYKYDELKRNIECIMFENEIIFKKVKYVYSGKESLSPIECIEWNADGAIEHEFSFTYFTVGNDTVTIMKTDKDNVSEISFISKDAQNVTTDKYETHSSILSDYQFAYDHGRLVSLRNLEKGADAKYLDDIAVITEKDGNGEETKKTFKRNNLIGETIKNKDGKVISSFKIVDNGDNRTVTIVNDSTTIKHKEKSQNGKIVTFIDGSTGISSNYVYNEAGFISEVNSSDGTFVKYDYDYDATNNWIRCVEYKNGKLTKIWERRIDYY